jgi:hypothetical protein
MHIYIHEDLNFKRIFNQFFCLQLLENHIFLFPLLSHFEKLNPKQILRARSSKTTRIDSYLFIYLFIYDNNSK